MNLLTTDSFNLQASQIDLVVVQLKTLDMTTLAHDLQQQAAINFGFFQHDPVLLDFSSVIPQQTQHDEHDQSLNAAFEIDFEGLLAVLREQRMLPIAVRGLPPKRTAQALSYGLADGADAKYIGTQTLNTAESTLPPLSETTHSPHSSVTPTYAPEQIREIIREVTREIPVAGKTVIIDTPMRSGQKAYAEGGDLVILAPVNVGAELIADGNIHVYAPLRGRAIAGARGLESARIFTQHLEAELLSIAGIYRTGEQPFEATVWRKAAQIYLADERLRIEPLEMMR
jgi:septum site-determining protein MinC